MVPPGAVETIVAPPWQKAASTGVQLPSTHASAIAQIVPQAPQFAGSYRVSEHTPEQFTSGLAHVTPHVPPTHTSPLPHSLSHAPQCSRSESRSRQLPEQSVNPPGHAAVQEPS